MAQDRAKVHLHLPPKYVKEKIPYTDKATGERKAFNIAKLPAGCRIGGEDMTGWEFSPLFVNESRFMEGWKHIPLLADRDVKLTRQVMEGGRPALDANGKRVKETREVEPEDLADAVFEALGIV